MFGEVLSLCAKKTNTVEVSEARS